MRRVYGLIPEAITWESCRMKRAIAIASVAIGAGCAASAWADSPQLKGSYAFTGTAVCLVAPGNWQGGFVNGIPVTPGPNTPAATQPFNNPTPGVALPNSGFKPNLQPNDTGPGLSTYSFTRSFSVEGVRTFDGNGHGTVAGTVVGVTHRPTPGPTGFPHFPPSAGVAEFSFEFDYQVTGDRFTSSMTPGTYTETFTAGPRGPQAGPPSVPAQTATVDQIPPVYGIISNDGKTLTLAHVDAVVETHAYSNGDVWPEICHRSRVLISLKDANGH
jgi:hypothetical protein